MPFEFVPMTAHLYKDVYFQTLVQPQHLNKEKCLTRVRQDKTLVKNLLKISLCLRENV